MRQVFVSGLLSLLVCCLLGQAPPTTLEGKVVNVADGDTLTLLAGKTQYRIRLVSIDAPEDGQEHGDKAKQYLKSQLQLQMVRVEVTGTDQYDRLLGVVYRKDENINEKLVTEGWAWQYREFDKSERLAKLEADAREAKRGLWSNSLAIPPWEYRALQERAATEKANPTPKGQRKYWLNTSSNVRHNATCRYFNNTSKGRFCGPNDGKACGICGG